MNLRRFALLGFIAAAGCGSSSARVPKPEDYGRSCNTADDCQAVYVGAPTCCDRQCANTAVNVADSERATLDTQHARICGAIVNCDPFPPPCQPGPAICVDGTCQLWQHPKDLSLDNYDRSCTSVSDCAAVGFDATGCCPTFCPNASVRVTQVPLITSDLEAFRGICARPVCSVDPRITCTGRLLCESGLCQLVDTHHDAGASGDSSLFVDGGPPPRPAPDAAGSD
jgi:hypothetical protein